MTPATSRTARASLLRENVRMALEAVRDTKLRSFLTVLGIVIGVGTLIGMVSMISGMGNSIKDQISSLGTGILYVSKFDTGFQSNTRAARQRKDVTDLDAVAIVEYCPSVVAVSPEIKVVHHVHRGGEHTSLIAVIGGTADFAQVNARLPAIGRFLTPDDLRHRAPVCVLGAGPADLLFPRGDPLGQWVQIESQRIQVVGVLEEKGKFLGQNMDDLVVLPLPLVARMKGYDREVDYLVVRPINPESVEDARDETTELLRRRRGVRADEKNDFGITSQENLMELYHQLTRVFFLLTLVISSIGLLVGGIGVMNMMLVSVKERTREIGVRAALGARRRDILGQFLIETITLTLVGGLLGMLLGFGLAGGVRLAFGVPMAVTATSILLTIGLSSAIGLFFGLYPAYRASRLDPIEALRYE